MEDRKRAGWPVFLWGAASLAILLLAASCDWGVPDYHLTVWLDPGISGTPEAGTYLYKELTQVEFDYRPENPLHTIEVFLNDKNRISSPGTITMYGDGYRLKAKLIDIRGVWKVTLTYSDASVTAPDPFLLTITGPDLVSGTFTDERGYHGMWTAASDVLTLAYWDWKFYVLGGTVYGLGEDPGTFTGDGLSGTWTAEKQE